MKILCFDFYIYSFFSAGKRFEEAFEEAQCP